MPRPNISITELPNSITTDIDLATPNGMVKLFRQTDAQIFNGWDIYDGLCDIEIIKKIKIAVDAAAEILTFKGKKKIIVAGAGTSGRLAMFISRNFNRLCRQKKIKFEYMIAGGDLALIKAQEGAEDDPITAQKELEKIVGDAEKILYIGVTCGLSAPYIAGQLDYTSDNSNKFFSILLGFNPLELARKISIENWDKRFYDVVEKIKKHPKCVILNPVVGPEPITGSTRMKGGSATKIILDVLFTASLIKADLLSPNDLNEFLRPYSSNMEDLIFNMIRQYENAWINTYSQLENIARLIDLGGSALNSHKHIYYIGSDVYGILGTIDASECPPTFGDSFDDIRGYLPNGWNDLFEAKRDLSNVGKEYHISLDYFKQEILPNLSPMDLVIFLGKEKDIELHETLFEKIKGKDTQLGAVLINPACSSFPGFDAVVSLKIEPLGLINNTEILAEFAMKLVLNDITTGAHILSGKIYHNRMIDLNISNTKLYYRTIGIIQEIVNVDMDTAVESILKSIYETDTLTYEQSGASISKHINACKMRKKIVPCALLIATGNFNFIEVHNAIEKEPKVRAIIEKIAKENNSKPDSKSKTLKKPKEKKR